LAAVDVIILREKYSSFRLTLRIRPDRKRESGAIEAGFGHEHHITLVKEQSGTQMGTKITDRPGSFPAAQSLDVLPDSVSLMAAQIVRNTPAVSAVDKLEVSDFDGSFIYAVS